MHQFISTATLKNMSAETPSTRYEQLFEAILTAITTILAFKFAVIWSNDPSDFYQDYCSGLALRLNIPLYTPEFQNTCLKFTGMSNESFHPPFNALLFAPLSLLPFKEAYLAWIVISLLFLQLSVSLVTRALSVPPKIRILTNIVIPIWYPTLYAIACGQSALFLSSLILLGWWALLSKKDLLVGVCWATAALIKLFPLFLMLPLLALRRIRAFKVYLVTLGLLCLATYFTLGSRNIWPYFNSIIKRNVDEWSIYPTVQSISGITSMLFKANAVGLNLIQNDLIASLSYALMVCIILLGTIYTYKSSCELAIGASILAMLLISPIMWLHTFSLALVCAVALLAKGSKKVRIIAILCIVCFSLPDVTIASEFIAAYPKGSLPLYAYAVIKTPTLALITLWGAFFMQSYKQRIVKV